MSKETNAIKKESTIIKDRDGFESACSYILSKLPMPTLEESAVLLNKLIPYQQKTSMKNERLDELVNSILMLSTGQSFTQEQYLIISGVFSHFDKDKELEYTIKSLEKIEKRYEFSDCQPYYHLHRLYLERHDKDRAFQTLNRIFIEVMPVMPSVLQNLYYTFAEFHLTHDSNAPHYEPYLINILKYITLMHLDQIEFFNPFVVPHAIRDIIERRNKLPLTLEEEFSNGQIIKALSHMNIDKVAFTLKFKNYIINDSLKLLGKYNEIISEDYAVKSEKLGKDMTNSSETYDEFRKWELYIKSLANQSALDINVNLHDGILKLISEN